MATQNNNIEPDITQTGGRRYNELQEIQDFLFGSRDSTADKSDADGYKGYIPPSRIDDPIASMSKPVYSPLYNEDTDEWWGRSRHDNDIENDSGWSRLSNQRAENQPWYEKLLNGSTKLVTTAGTTFIDNTIGVLYGLMQGILNVSDDNPETTFWQGLWDNDVNRAMTEFQNTMERVAPNYYSDKELNNPWYDSIFSTNFLADKILKNAGFTVGTLLSAGVPGSNIIGTGANLGLQGIAKLVAGAKVANSGFRATANTLKAGKIAGGIAEKVINTFASANGEAMIEAMNAVKDADTAQLQNIDRWEGEAVQRARDSYRLTGDIEAYNRNMREISERKQEALDYAASEMRNLGNSVYWGNVILLSLTNNIEFGKYIKGGWNPQKGIRQFRWLVEGKETKDIGEFLKGVARGTARTEVPEELGRLNAGKFVGGSLARAASEGFEEGAQRVISDASQMREQALMNRWARQHRDDDSLLAATINPDIEEELVDRMKAIGNVWKESFGDPSSSGWEEVFLGAVTGIFGVPFARHTEVVDKEGKKRKRWDIWSGGFVEEIRNVRDAYEEAQRTADRFNSFVGDSKKSEMRERFSHAIAVMSLTDDMDDALDSDDILMFKNRELLSLAADALFFKNQGLLEGFKTFYEEMAKQVSDKDIADVKAMMKDTETGKSWFDGKTDDELRKMLTDKAQSTLDKINNVLSISDTMEQLYADKYSKVDAKHTEDKDPAGAEFDYTRVMLREMSAKAALIDDMRRRLGELKQRAENNDESSDNTLRNEDIGKQIEQLQKKIDKTEAEFRDYRKNPEKLWNSVNTLFTELGRAEAAKTIEGTKERLMRSRTMGDALEMFRNVWSKEYAVDALHDAIAELPDGDQKEMLKKLYPLLSALNSLPDTARVTSLKIINDVLNDSNVSEEDKKGIIKDRITSYYNTIGNLVNDYLSDENVQKTNEGLHDYLTRRADEITDGSIRETIKAAADIIGQIDNTYSDNDDYRKARKERDKRRKETFEKKAGDQKKEQQKKTGSQQKKEEGKEEGKKGKDEKGEEETPEEIRRKRSGNKIPIKNGEEKKEEKPEEKPEERPESKPEENPGQDGESGQRQGEPEKAKVSFRGRAYDQYDDNELRTKGDAVRIEGTYSRAVQEKGFNIHYIQDNLLRQLMQLYPDNRLPVQFMVMREGRRGSSDGNIAKGQKRPYIFLVVPVTRDVQRTVDSARDEVNGNVIASGGRDYLVVGSLGFSGNDTALAQQYDWISGKLEDKVKRTKKGSEFYVLAKAQAYTYIYDNTPGYVMRRSPEEVRNRDTAEKDLKYLLEHENPMDIKLEDIPFEIIEKESNKEVNTKDKVLRHPKNTSPGQVYMYIKASDGTWIPQLINPVTFHDLKTSQKYYKKIKDVIESIAKAGTPEARVRGISQLRDLLVFTSASGQAQGFVANLLYDKDSDTITVEKARNTTSDPETGADRYVIDFRSTVSEDERINKLLNALDVVNPRISVTPADLSNINILRELMDDGLMKVNLSQLGTVQSSSYAYPVNIRTGKPLLRFAASENSTVTTAPRTESLFVDNRQYNIVTDSTGTVVMTDDGTALPKPLQEVVLFASRVNSHKVNPVILTVGKRKDGTPVRQEYYVSDNFNETTGDGFVLQKTGRGAGYHMLNQTETQKFIADRKRYNKTRAAIEIIDSQTKGKETGSPEGKNSKDLAQKGMPEDEKPVVPEQKKIEPAGQFKKNQKFFQLRRTDPVLRTMLEGVDALKGMTAEEKEKAMYNGKNGKLYRNIKTVEDAKKYIERIKQCGL